MTVLGNYQEHVTNRDVAMLTNNQGVNNRGPGGVMFFVIC